MGRTACGVIGIDIADDDMVVNMSVAEENKTVMTITEKGYGKRTPLDEYRLQSRGGKGVITHDLTDKTGDMVDLRLVREDQDLMMINDDSTVIRIPVEGIRPMSRSTQGVRVMRLNDEAKIVSVTEIDAEDKEDEAPETTESGE
jgi:DNA gyrase subunit A